MKLSIQQIYLNAQHSWVTTNGFIEVYKEPLGYRGAYENIVQINDFDMSQKMKVLSDNAQWFEDNSTLMEAHKKDSVVGVTYKVVSVAGEAGDASPSTPIGVNLPNANWIRAAVGSKSVSLGNFNKTIYIINITFSNFI